MSILRSPQRRPWGSGRPVAGPTTLPSLFPHIGCNRPEKLIPHDIQILKDDAETSESLDDHSRHWVTSCLSLPENLLRARIHGTWHYHGDCSNKTHMALSSWALLR